MYKKLIMVLIILLAFISLAEAGKYYDFTRSTTTEKADWRLRGDMRIGISTGTADTKVRILSTGTLELIYLVFPDGVMTSVIVSTIAIGAVGNNQIVHTDTYTVGGLINHGDSYTHGDSTATSITGTYIYSDYHFGDEIYGTNVTATNDVTIGDEILSSVDGGHKLDFGQANWVQLDVSGTHLIEGWSSGTNGHAEIADHFYMDYIYFGYGTKKSTYTHATGNWNLGNDLIVKNDFTCIDATATSITATHYGDGSNLTGITITIPKSTHTFTFNGSGHVFISTDYYWDGSFVIPYDLELTSMTIWCSTPAEGEDIEIHWNGYKGALDSPPSWSYLDEDGNSLFTLTAGSTGTVIDLAVNLSSTTWDKGERWQIGISSHGTTVGYPGNDVHISIQGYER